MVLARRAWSTPTAAHGRRACRRQGERVDCRSRDLVCPPIMRRSVVLLCLALLAPVPVPAVVDLDFVVHNRMRGDLHVSDPDVQAPGRLSLDVKFAWFASNLQSV